MKILQYITRMDEIGGAQVHVLELTKGLIERGHEVIVISSGQGVLTKNLKKLAVPYYTLKHLNTGIHPLKDLQNYVQFKKILQTHQPDLIALHSSKSGVIGRVSSRTLRIPTVFTVHGWSFSNESPLKFRLYLLIERIVGRIPTGIITVSHYDDSLTKRYLKGLHEKRIVVHNGIHNTLSLSKPNEVQKVVQLVMVARFAKPKDHELLLNALALIPNKNWHLTFAGDGPLLNNARDKALELDLSNQISFLGEIEDIESLLQQADIFLLITKSEGLPISIIEAMRARLAIIASDVGGISELIDHNKNGLLVDASNTDSLASAIELLLNNFSMRKAFAYQAREKYVHSFSFKTMLDKTENYYLQVMKEYPPKRRVGV